MTEQADNLNQDTEMAAEDMPIPTELEILKQQATLMGIKFSNNIGVEALRAKIEAKRNNEPEEPEQKEVAASVNALDPTGEGNRKVSAAEQIRLDAMKLVRIRVTNMDPRDKDLPGEIFTVANDYIGNVRKYVPYVDHEDGWHVPQCILNVLQEKQFMQIKTIKDKLTGRTRHEMVLARKFGIEILPPLTKEELDQLAVAQRAAAGL